MARGYHPVNMAWDLVPVETVDSYQPPNYFQKGWKHRTAQRFAVVDRSLAYVRAVPAEIYRDGGGRLLCTSDGSIWMFAHDSAVDFMYFGLQEEPDLRTSMEVSALPSGDGENAELRRHLEACTLSAFVCAPLSNPLTRKIGPRKIGTNHIIRNCWAG
jgi:hypothetical protein